MPLIPTLRKQRQEDPCKFKVYIVSSHIAKAT